MVAAGWLLVAVIGLAACSIGSTPDTVFDIGKVTNQLTATAVLLLADEGELRLDDPVSTYLDGLPGWADDVTVTNLIHHTSGLPDYVDLLTDQGFEPQDPTTQTQALEALGTTAELQFAPGSIFRHSNSDYLLLAEIVRAATDRRCHRFWQSGCSSHSGLT